MSLKYLRVSALLSRSCLRQLMRKAPQLGFQLAQQCSRAQARLPRRDARDPITVAILVLRRVTWGWGTDPTCGR